MIRGTSRQAHALKDTGIAVIGTQTQPFGVDLDQLTVGTLSDDGGPLVIVETVDRLPAIGKAVPGNADMATALPVGKAALEVAVVEQIRAILRLAGPCTRHKSKHENSNRADDKK